MSSSVTTRFGVRPSNVAALMIRLRSVTGPSRAGSNGADSTGRVRSWWPRYGAARRGACAEGVIASVDACAEVGLSPFLPQSAHETEMRMLATDYPLLNLFWTMVEIFFFVIWIWILITVLIDVFRSHDLSGWAKALWLVFIVFLPLLGVLIYLIARGGSMHERARPGAKAQDAAMQEYVRSVAVDVGWREHRRRAREACGLPRQGRDHRRPVRSAESQAARIAHGRRGNSFRPRRLTRIPNADGDERRRASTEMNRA